MSAHRFRNCVVIFFFKPHYKTHFANANNKKKRGRYWISIKRIHEREENIIEILLEITLLWKVQFNCFGKRTKKMNVGKRKKRRKKERSSVQYLLQWIIKWNKSELTYPEAHFEILAAPDVHALVVGAQFIEIFFVYGKETAGHRRCPQRRRSIALPSVHFPLSHAVPVNPHLQYVAHLGAQT